MTTSLAPRSVPYRVAENGVRIAGILVFSLLFSAGDSSADAGAAFEIGSTLVLVVLGVGAVAIWETAYVRRYTYQVTADTFDIQSGVVSRREREIPFERIQNVDIAQNVVQRALGIAEVRLETAGGGGGSEARLRYVTRQEATRLQELISERKRSGTERDPDATGDVLFELGREELTVLGLTSANFRLFGLVVVGLSVLGSGAAQQAQVASPRASILLLLGPAAAVLGLVALWLLSGLQAVLRYYGFRLLRRDDELRYERGLLQRYNGTIPLSKVQTLMIRENILARTAGYASLAVETAGYAPGQDGNSVESAVPIAKRDRVVALTNTIESVGDPAFKRPPKRARTRYLVRYTAVVVVLLGLLGAANLVWGLPPYWYLAGLLWLFVPPAAHLKWSHIGYYHDEDHIVTRSGFWTRRTTIVPYYRIQTVSDSQTVFQRRRDLGTLTVDTASSGGFWGGDAVALDIDIDVARRLREQVHDRFHESVHERRAQARAGPRAPVNERSDPPAAFGTSSPTD
jgi:putative membrane protein